MYFVSFLSQIELLIYKLVNSFITTNTYFLSDNMFSSRKGKQTTFVYGPEIYEKLVSRDHLLYKINESMNFTFINGECRNLYSEKYGETCNEHS